MIELHDGELYTPDICSVHELQELVETYETKCERAKSINFKNIELHPICEMVTGIGYCARRGKRRREKQTRHFIENPEKYHFWPPPKLIKPVSKNVEK